MGSLVKADRFNLGLLDIIIGSGVTKTTTSRSQHVNIPLSGLVSL